MAPTDEATAADADRTVLLALRAAQRTYQRALEVAVTTDRSLSLARIALAEAEEVAREHFGLDTPAEPLP